jgi:hypothetical protein
MEKGVLTPAKGKIAGKANKYVVVSHWSEVTPLRVICVGGNRKINDGMANTVSNRNPIITEKALSLLANALLKLFEGE